MFKYFFNLISRAFDDTNFARRGLKAEDITNTIAHILSSRILIACLSTQDRFVCFKKSLQESLKTWQEMPLRVQGKY